MVARRQQWSLSRREFLGGVALGIGGPLLAGCAASPSTPTPAPASPATTAPTAQTASQSSQPTATPAAQAAPQGSGAATKLSFWRHQYDPTDQVYKNTIFPAAAKDLGVTFDYQVQRGDDYSTKMLPQIASGGGGPDIFEAGEDFRYKFSNAGVFAPLDYTPWGGEAAWQSFWAPGIVDALKVNGKDYVVPLEWTAFPENYFVRQDDAKAAGIPDSDFSKYQQTAITWDALPEWAAKMTVKDAQGRVTRDGFMIQHGYGAGRTYEFFNEHYRELGGQPLSTDGKTSTLNNDQAIAVLQYLSDLVFKSGASMLRPQSNESGSGVLPKNGTASTIGLGFWAYPTFQSLDPTNWQTVRCLLTPQVHPDKPLYLTGPGNSYGVNSHSSHVALGFKVLHYFAAHFGSQLFDGGITAPVKDWTSKYPGVKKLPDADVWVKLANDASVLVAPPAELLSETVRQQGFQRAFESVMFNKVSVKDAIAQWNKDVQDSLS